MADAAAPNAPAEAGVQSKSAEEVMREQEAQLLAKYGGMKPKMKKGGLMGKDHSRQYFDSADWAMKKEAAAKAPDGAAAEQPPAEEKLIPKLEPSAPPPRRVSHLDPMEKLV